MKHIINLEFPQINSAYGKISLVVSPFEYVVILPEWCQLKPTRHHSEHGAIQKCKEYERQGYVGILIIDRFANQYVLGKTERLIKISD